MSNVLIIGVFESFFLALLLFTKKKNTVSDSILALFFLVFGISIGFSLFESYNRNNGFPYPALILTTAPFLLLHGPLLWLYIKSLTNQYFKVKPIYLLHGIPFLLMLIQHSVQIFFLPANEKIEMAQTESFRHFYSYYFFVFAISFSPLVYYYFGLKLINRYKLKIEGYFSDTSGIDLKWLRLIIGSWLVVHCIINAFFIADLFIPIASFGMMQFLSFLMATVYIIFIGFYGLKQENVFHNRTINLDLEKAAALQPMDQYKTSLPAPEKEFIRRLLDFMRDEKPWLEPDITIKSLSERLNVSTEYFSEVINSDLNKNFFDFINHYRVEEFKAVCKKESNTNLTITGLAFNCGFNSKASFYRAFSKNTGMSPSEYINEVSQKSETPFS